MASPTPPFITFVHAGGDNDTPENARRGEVLDEWWPNGPILPAVGDVVWLGDDRWRVTVRELRKVEGARVVAVLHVAPVRKGKA
jgi:hypothetical protein